MRFMRSRAATAVLWGAAASLWGLAFTGILELTSDDTEVAAAAGAVAVTVIAGLRWAVEARRGDAKKRVSEENVALLMTVAHLIQSDAKPPTEPLRRLRAVE